MDSVTGNIYLGDTGVDRHDLIIQNRRGSVCREEPSLEIHFEDDIE
jgi:hypothetical protein